MSGLLAILTPLVAWFNTLAKWWEHWKMRQEAKTVAEAEIAKREAAIAHETASDMLKPRTLRDVIDRLRSGKF